MSETLTSVEKALQLLELMSARPGPRGVSELNREMGLTKSNVHRLLKTLCAAGYVRHWPEQGKYSSTLKLWELGSRVVEGIDVREIAQRHIATLSTQVHETVHLSVLEGFDVVYIDRLESENSIRTHTRIGSRAPANCVATGKAMLAFLEDSQIEQFRGHLRAGTPGSITDFETFKRALQQVRKRGYAITRGEWRPNVFGVGAPVFGVNNSVVAGIGMSCPDIQLTKADIDGYISAVQSCASAVSRDCGYREQSQ